MDNNTNLDAKAETQQEQKSNDKKYRIVFAYFLGTITVFPIFLSFDLISPYLGFLTTVFVILIFLLGFIGLILIVFRDYIFLKVFGIEKTDLKTLDESSKALLNGVLERDKEKIKQHFAISSKIISFWLAKLAFRRWAIGVFYTLFISFAGIMGAVLLYKQNDIISKQSVFLASQNQLIQQELNHNQEKGLRDSYKADFQILSKQINQELKEDFNGDGKRDISSMSIAKIGLFCSKVKPYRLSIQDSLLSPEKGELLFFLHLSDLDTSSYDKIYSRANFTYSDLRFMNFTKAYFRDINLDHSNLSYSDFEEASFIGAKLNEVKARESNFDKADFRIAEYWEGGDYKGTSMQYVDFRDFLIENKEAIIFEHEEPFTTNFQESNLNGAIFHLIPDAKITTGYQIDTLKGLDDFRVQLIKRTIQIKRDSLEILQAE